MPTTTFADYQVLLDGAFTLDAATPIKEKILHFDMPDDFLITSDKRKPILAFHASPSQETRFKVFINERQILSWHLLADAVKGMWSPVSAAEVFPEGQSFPTSVPVRFLVSEGKIKFEHVLLWFQVRRE
jgi:hypothetical protein